MKNIIIDYYYYITKYKYIKVNSRLIHRKFLTHKLRIASRCSHINSLIKLFFIDSSF